MSNSSFSPSAFESRELELLTYFESSDQDSFTNCHEEKSPFEDFSNGKKIPRLLVEKYELYQFNISPIANLKYRIDNPAVIIRGGLSLKYAEKQILFYQVGIEMESEETNEYEGVDTRMLVLSEDGEILRNYFVGGYMLNPGDEEEVVCRKVTFEGEQAIMTIRDDGSLNIPSHLKLPPVQELDLD